ncbi:hypothetical protein DL95DRAFT_93824 [Leptodontidium sp. 2 PMI_412]|nr:hypothetical protein DL95DRAFT_93824 [Leptodontidium sp. 2 PMI_412]
MSTLMETTPATESPAEQGRGKPRRREAFLGLARLYRMKGMPKAGFCRRRSRSGTPVKIAMVRQRSEELCLAQARISANTTRTEAMIAGLTVMRIDSRVVDRGFGLQRGHVKVFSCGEAVEGRFRVGPDEELTEYSETRTAARAGTEVLLVRGHLPDRQCRRSRDAGGKSSSSSSMCHAQWATAQQMASFTSYLGCEAFLPLGMFHSDEQVQTETCMKRGFQE